MEGGNYIVSWCFGHLVELADASSYDERYAKWRYDDLPSRFIVRGMVKRGKLLFTCSLKTE